MHATGRNGAIVAMAAWEPPKQSSSRGRRAVRDTAGRGWRTYRRQRGGVQVAIAAAAILLFAAIGAAGGHGNEKRMSAIGTAPVSTAPVAPVSPSTSERLTSTTNAPPPTTVAPPPPHAPPRPAAPHVAPTAAPTSPAPPPTTAPPPRRHPSDV